MDPRVLIPRPETEYVVDVALAELGRSVEAMAPVSPPIAADLGTGSGAIALSLAVEGGAIDPRLEVWATDVSSDALEVARANLEAWPAAIRRRPARVASARGRGSRPCRSAGRSGRPVVSNPPYVTEAEYLDLDPIVRDLEPRLALVAGSGTERRRRDGRIEAIVDRAAVWLRPRGRWWSSCPRRRPRVVDLARRAGFDSGDNRP